MVQSKPDYLVEAGKYGINPGLDTIKGLLRRIGDPERDFPVVHIAGTNGKGSVASFAASMLAASGLRTGLYTSPYLERFTESIVVIDGPEGLARRASDDSEGEIPSDRLDGIIDIVRKASDSMVEEGERHPTEFELTTAIAFEYFSQAKVDIAVIECGMGGRLDATNVFDSKDVAVITPISVDHTRFLGNTIEEIAREKAGIITEGCHVICAGPSSAEVRKVLEDAAASKGCPIGFIEAEGAHEEYSGDFRMRIALPELYGRVASTSLLGHHQCLNMKVALAAVLSLREKFPSITDDTVIDGIDLARWKCRAEVISTDPFLIMDGGHNPQGAGCFADVYSRLDGGDLIRRPVRLIIGVMRDKDIAGVISAYKDAGIAIEQVWPVRVDNPRTADPDELYNIIKQVYNKPIGRGAEEDPEQAVERAWELSKEDGIPIIITGSLYLCGQVRGVLRGIADA